MTPRPSAPPGALAALAQAWGILGSDPVRLLGLSAVALLLELATVVLAWRWAVSGGPWWIAAGIGLGRALAVGVARARLLALGARTVGRAPRGPVRGIVAGVGTELLALLLVIPAAALATVPFGGVGLAIGAQGLLPGAILAAASALAAAWLASVAVRAALAPWLARAVLHPEIRAPFGFALRIVLFGDILRTTGALALAAGALPAYPLPLLAWLARLPPVQRPARSAP